MNMTVSSCICVLLLELTNKKQYSGGQEAEKQQKMRRFTEKRGNFQGKSNNIMMQHHNNDMYVRIDSFDVKDTTRLKNSKKTDFRG